MGTFAAVVANMILPDDADDNYSLLVCHDEGIDGPEHMTVVVERQDSSVKPAAKKQREDSWRNQNTGPAPTDAVGGSHAIDNHAQSSRFRTPILRPEGESAPSSRLTSPSAKLEVS